MLCNIATIVIGASPTKLFFVIFPPNSWTPQYRIEPKQKNKTEKILFPLLTIQSENFSIQTKNNDGTRTNFTNEIEREQRNFLIDFNCCQNQKRNSQTMVTLTALELDCAMYRTKRYSQNER